MKPTLEQSAIAVLEKLTKQGHLTYFAGGCVRDQLLGNIPKDYDIATAATPEQVLEVFPKGDSIGAHFGVILVKEGGFYFEIATFRTDGDYQDGRRPESVTYSSPQEDAKRRDFTINALFYDPISGAGEVIDFVEGKVDLSNQLIRAVGEASHRFQEDGLRLLRAIRFATKLGFRIEEKTWAAIREQSSVLKLISMERVNIEFSKILLSPNRAEGLQLLVDSGLIDVFLPEVLDLIGCEQPPQWHPEGDVYQHTKLMLKMIPDDSPIELVLAVLLHDIGKPATYTVDETGRIRFNGHDKVGAEMARGILNRLKYSNAVIEDVVAMVDNHMNFMHVQQMRMAKVKRFMARSTYELEMELHRVDCGSSNGLTENYDFLRQREEEFSKEPLIPPPLVTGKDLIDLGFQPGPVFKEVLQAVQNEQLEKRLDSKELAIAYIRREFLDNPSDQ